MTFESEHHLFGDSPTPVLGMDRDEMNVEGVVLDSGLDPRDTTSLELGIDPEKGWAVLVVQGEIAGELGLWEQRRPMLTVVFDDRVEDISKLRRNAPSLTPKGAASEADLHNLADTSGHPS